MKKLLFLSVIGLVLVACSGDSEGDPTPAPVENRAPSVPNQTAPVNNLLCIDNAVVFEWSAASDPDGDIVSYELQIATNNAFSENLETRLANTTSATVTLEKGIAYYWRVKAIDSKNASSDYSTVYSFYTEGEGERNHLPFLPELIGPDLDALVQTTSVELKWEAADVDVDDTLTFDVYMDVVNPPTVKVAENTSAKSFTADIASAKTYFWRIVVKDDKGGSATGNVWSFKTD